MTEGGGSPPFSLSRNPHLLRGFFVRGEEVVDDVACQSRGAQAAGVDAAPAGFDFGQHLFTATDDGFVEGARALHLFQQDGGDHVIVQEGGVAIGDFMLERDPQVPGNSLRRGQGAPMVQHGLLHPFEVAGIVDMTHEVDVGGIDADGILMGNRVTHNDVNIIVAAIPIGAFG